MVSLFLIPIRSVLIYNAEKGGVGQSCVKLAISYISTLNRNYEHVLFAFH